MKNHSNDKPKFKGNRKPKLIKSGCTGSGDQGSIGSAKTGPHESGIEKRQWWETQSRFASDLMRNLPNMIFMIGAIVIFSNLIMSSLGGTSAEGISDFKANGANLVYVVKMVSTTLPAVKALISKVWSKNIVVTIAVDLILVGLLYAQIKEHHRSPITLPRSSIIQNFNFYTF